MTSKTEETTKTITKVKKQPNGLYVWAYPGMGQFDSFKFSYVEEFFKTRKAEFEIIFVKDDNSIK